MPQTWADLGAGNGLFTRALASLLEPGSTISAVDKSLSSLNEIQRGGPVEIKIIHKDFVTQEIGGHPFEGVVMANSIHFVRDKPPLFAKLKRNLKPHGRLILVEYDLEKPSRWVPFPLSYDALVKFSTREGLRSVRKIGTVQSQLNPAAIYSALLTY